jgi:hypothetical protein
MKTLVLILALFFHVMLIIVSSHNQRYNVEYEIPVKYPASVDTMRPPVRMDLTEFTDSHPGRPDPHSITRLILDVNKPSRRINP